MLSPNAWVAALIVVAVSCAVIALAAVAALLVLLGVARRLARLEAEFERVVGEARRETAATLQSVRGAAEEVQALAGAARRLELPLAVALGWLGAQKGLPVAVASTFSLLKGFSGRARKGNKKGRAEDAPAQPAEGRERQGEAHPQEPPDARGRPDTQGPPHPQEPPAAHGRPAPEPAEGGSA